MECKYLYTSRYKDYETAELIDTLWNVNSSPSLPIHYIRNKELIDTLWNVNINVLQDVDKRIAELIDTLWNVNVIPGLMYYCLDYELIDTLWNVNTVFLLVVPLNLSQN